MNRRNGSEFKVGFFVVVAAAILVMLVLKAGNYSLKPGYTVRFLFGQASGIDEGSPVRLAGVNIGEVKEVRVIRSVEGQTQAEVIAWVTQGVLIEDDAQVNVGSLGLLGEKYIEIVPGTAGEKAVGHGGVLVGRSPLGFEELAASGNRMMGKIEKAADSVNQVVADPKFQSDVKGTFGNAEKVSKNLMEASEDLKDAAKSARIVLGRLRDGEGAIGRLLKNDKMAKDLEAFAEDIKAHPWKLLKRG